MKNLESAAENLDYSKINDYIQKKNSEFLANLSFELRSPLNEIVGLVYLLKDTQLNEEQRKYLSHINKSSLAVVEVISNVLDISRIDAKYSVVDRMAFTIEDIASYIDSFCRLKAHDSNLKFTISIDSSLPQSLLGDKQKLTQILQNLISNAFKFTDSGEVNIELRKINQTDQHITLQIQVSDTGIGIPEIFLSKIFFPFTRVDKTTTRKFSGAGLGLTVCSRMVQLMGGEISAKSVVGKGSTFTVTLPFERTDFKDTMNDSKPNQTNAELLTGKNILVVDDAEINQMISRKILEKLGVVVTTASTGLQAVNLVAKQNFDIVLMDIQMPIMDGYEATQRIRKDEKNANLPIIAVSAAALEEDRHKSIASGMNDHIAKPFDPHTIGQILSKWIR